MMPKTTKLEWLLVILGIALLTYHFIARWCDFWWVLGVATHCRCL